MTQKGAQSLIAVKHLDNKNQPCPQGFSVFYMPAARKSREGAGDEVATQISTTVLDDVDSFSDRGLTDQHRSFTDKYL